SPAIGGSNPANGFADLAGDTSDAKTVGGANGHALLRVETNDRRRKTMCQQRRNSTDRSRSALHIVEREIAFGGRVKLQDLRNRKTRLKGFPHIAAQTVAAGQPKP